MSVKILNSTNNANKKCKKRIGGGQIYEKIEGCFYLSCLMVTLVLSISCCIEYSKNDDVTQISVKPFGMKEVVAYPDISFCLEDYDIFTQTKNTGIDVLEYYDFLEGVFWDSSFPTVDYDEMTWNLTDHIYGVPHMHLRDPSYKIDKDRVTLNPFGGSRYKCFTLGVPPEESITSVSLSIRKSLFAKTPELLSRFQLRLHHPQQIFRSWQFRFSNWLLPENASSMHTKVDINIRDVEILRRRNKWEHPCVDAESYDAFIIDQTLNNVGCKPPYFQNFSSLPLCTNQEEMEKIDEVISDYYHGRTQAPPCKEMAKVIVDFTIQERKACDANVFVYDVIGKYLQDD